MNMKILKSLFIIVSLCSMAATCPFPTPTPTPLPEITIASSVAYWTPPTTNKDGSLLTDLKGFKIYAESALGSFTTVYNVSNPLTTSVPLKNFLSAPGSYYITITAYDQLGLESSMSSPYQFTAK